MGYEHLLTYMLKYLLLVKQDKQTVLGVHLLNLLISLYIVEDGQAYPNEIC